MYLPIFPRGCPHRIPSFMLGGWLINGVGRISPLVLLDTPVLHEIIGNYIHLFPFCLTRGAG